MQSDIEHIAEGLSEAQRGCILAYSRSHDAGWLDAKVYTDRGFDVCAHWFADMIERAQGKPFLWERKDRPVLSTILASYRLTPLGQAVREYLMEKNK